MLFQIVQKVADLQDAISEGATSFLFTEYKYMGVFMVRKFILQCCVPYCCHDFGEQRLWIKFVVCLEIPWPSRVHGSTIL